MARVRSLVRETCSTLRRSLFPLLKPFHWKPWKIEHERIERDVIWETGITRDRG